MGEYRGAFDGRGEWRVQMSVGGKRSGGFIPSGIGDAHKTSDAGCGTLRLSGCAQAVRTAARAVPAFVPDKRGSLSNWHFPKLRTVDNSTGRCAAENCTHRMVSIVHFPDPVPASAVQNIILSCGGVLRA
jgi:hypothetical protein